MPRPLRIAALCVLLLLFCAPQDAGAVMSPIARNRPAYRATKVKGRQDKKRKIPTLPIKSPREYRDLLSGWRAEYPNEWNTSLSAPETGVGFAHYDWTRFSHNLWPETTLAVGVLDLKKPVTTADLAKSFADFTRNPQYAEEYRNPNFLLMVERVSSEKSSWKGRETLDSTFTHRLQSKETKTRQIRIPVSHRILVLEYSAVAGRFDSDLHYFEDFVKSFRLL